MSRFADSEPAARESGQGPRYADSAVDLRESDQASRLTGSNPTTRGTGHPPNSADTAPGTREPRIQSANLPPRNKVPPSPPSPFLQVPSPSYSPITSPEPEEISPPPSPAPSIEFIDELERVPPRPRYYRYDGTQTSLIELLEQFPVKVDPLFQSLRDFTINPNGLDLEVLLDILPALAPTDPILVFTSHYYDPFAVPSDFFYNFFPPSTTIITEIE